MESVIHSVVLAFRGWHITQMLCEPETPINIYLGMAASGFVLELALRSRGPLQQGEQWSLCFCCHETVESTRKTHPRSRAAHGPITHKPSGEMQSAREQDAVLLARHRKKVNIGFKRIK